jgi:3-oxoadipate enol-lactonase
LIVPYAFRVAAGLSKDTLLLIAGLGQGVWVWRDVVPTLERACRVIAFEARGTGTRAGLPPRHSVKEMATDVRAELGGPAHVLGSSLGGHVALTLALEAPEVVRSLLLFATGGGGPGRVPRPRYVAQAISEAVALPDRELAERTMPLTFAPGWVAANPERFREIIAARMKEPTPNDLLEAHAAACYRFYAEGCEAERIRAPALVVHGDQDLIIPVENGRMLANRLPRVEYVELPGRGHNLMFEDPETFARLVLEFLARVAAAADPMP